MELTLGVSPTQSGEGSQIDVSVWMACNFTAFHQVASIINSIQGCFLVPRVKRVILSIYANVVKDPNFPTLHDPNNWSEHPELLEIPKGKVLIVRKRSDVMDSFGHYKLIASETDKPGPYPGGSTASMSSRWVTLCAVPNMLLPKIGECYEQFGDAFYAKAYVTINKETQRPLPQIREINGKTAMNFVESHRDEMDTDTTSETGISMKFHIIRDFLRNYEVHPKAKLFGAAGVDLLNQNAMHKMLDVRKTQTSAEPVVLTVFGLGETDGDINKLLDTILSVVDDPPGRDRARSGPRSGGKGPRR